MNAFKSLRSFLLALMFIIMFMAGAVSAATTIILRSTGIINFKSQNLLIMVPLVFNIIIGMMIAGILSYSYVKPIKRLIAATKEISKGNFDVRVKVKERADSEFAELERSFNSMAQELGSIELFKKSFINDFSHEFKTPIVSIRGFAKQLKSPEIDDATKDAYIDIIVAESERLANLSSNVLLLSRLENQSIISDQSDFMLDEQIRQCILLLEKDWTQKDISFDIDLTPIKVHTSVELISQVWINLLSNAIKFSHQGGTVITRCFVRDGRAVVEIEDNGIGMTSEQLEKIFDKFYQGDPSRKSEGNGLGMSIAGKIVDILKGSIEVRSTPNIGSLFIITLDILTDN